jgi:antitoxin YefM
MDEAVESRKPLVVTRQSGRGNVVMMSEEEFEGWQETVHLLRSPRNAERLLRSIRSAAAGRASERRLVPSGR